MTVVLPERRDHPFRSRQLLGSSGQWAPVTTAAAGVQWSVGFSYNTPPSSPLSLLSTILCADSRHENIPLDHPPPPAYFSVSHLISFDHAKPKSITCLERTGVLIPDFSRKTQPLKGDSGGIEIRSEEERDLRSSQRDTLHPDSCECLLRAGPSHRSSPCCPSCRSCVFRPCVWVVLWERARLLPGAPGGQGGWGWALHGEAQPSEGRAFCNESFGCRVTVAESQRTPWF